MILPFSSFPVPDFYKLTMKYSLVLVQFLRQYIGIDCSVKWPNDIYVGNNKLAGILIQNLISGRNIQYSIFGLGLNVNSLDFPENIPNPISLAQIKGHSYPLLELQYKLSDYLSKHLVFDESLTKIKSEYLKTLYRYNIVSEFEDLNADRFKAKIIDVLDNGHLVVEKEKGTRNSYNFGDIRYII
jgi:BirA family biotin operon repressor/biotin-[acetyl-CoA-carboxylase] ligase